MLVVDDSALARKAIGLLIEQDPSLYVMGIARTGKEAIEKTRRLMPDVVMMDIQMPELDGIAALDTIMAECPVPVIMMTGHSRDHAHVVSRALQLGAVDVLHKEGLIGDSPSPANREQFLAQLKEAAISGSRRREEEPPVADEPDLPLPGEIASPYELIVIGCSTGGPAALQTILPKFPAAFPASIVIVQHMPPGFTKPLAERLDSICQLKVKEACEGEVLHPGTVYIAPAGYQTLLDVTDSGRYVFQLADSDGPFYKPSIDVTLDSVAHVFRDKCLAVILTGMGSDGLKGCRAVKSRNGMVITESEQTCVVYGMPKVVHEAGLSDGQVPLSQMFGKIMSLVIKP